MNQARQTKHHQSAVRIQIDTPVSFDEILRRLREQTGASSVPAINEAASTSKSVAEFEDVVNARYRGPSGFMVFDYIDHSPWIKRYDVNRRLLRVILGNPLIAITMLRQDLSAGLFAPVELLLIEQDNGVTLHYVEPSTLIVTNDNPALRSAAEALDRKLAVLVANITSPEDGRSS